MTDDLLRYGFGKACVGVVVAAVSKKGVAAIFVGNDRPQLRRALGDAFPTTDLIEDEAATADVLAAIVAVIDDPERRFEFPLDVRGSATELVVWEALRAIPAGQTRTYGQIAKGLSVAVTAQDVGAACAANVLAVVIPCHRVIKADGSISGYRWGVGRKRRLLQMEIAA